MENYAEKELSNGGCKNSMSPAGAFLKRTADILMSAMGMVILSPLYLVIWVAIKIESPGPAIFRQERIGLGGRPFTLYKFRSMVADAEHDGIPALCGESDDRLTGVGAFIRRHHLDELPQLWNVLAGDMSMVGYRPERQYFIDKIMAENPDYERLFSIRPGVFSTATLYNGYTDTMEKMLKRLEMDLEYLDNWSMWSDMKIIFLTAMAIITGKHF